MQYDMKPVEAPQDGDVLQEAHGLTFYIPLLAKAYLSGVQIDFSDDLMDTGFKFSNPNADSACGCGTSFGMKNTPERDKKPC